MRWLLCWLFGHEEREWRYSEPFTLVVGVKRYELREMRCRRCGQKWHKLGGRVK